jgi:hypothetical protein
VGNLDCQRNLVKMGTVVEIYACDNNKQYPDSLSKLTPKYLTAIPTCPASKTFRGVRIPTFFSSPIELGCWIPGRDTYSPGYQAHHSPEAFTIICMGSFHTAFCPPGYPQYSSIFCLLADPAAINEKILELASQDDLTTVKQVLARNPSALDEKDMFGRTVLHYAAMNSKGSAEVARFLLSQGLNIQVKDRNGVTPLHCAGTSGMAAFLISKGAKVNARDLNGNTPLHCAAMCGYTDTAALLISKGVEINARNKKGYTALTLAREKHHGTMVKLLVAHGAK